MLVIIEMKGSDENKRSQLDRVAYGAMALGEGECFENVPLEAATAEDFEMPGGNLLVHDWGGADWDNLPWMAAVKKVMGETVPRIATIDVLVTSKTLPSKARFMAAAVVSVDVNDPEDVLVFAERMSMLGRSLKDARRYRALVNLGTMRQIGSAGFNGRERIKNEHYYHMTFDMWSTGYEGAYTSDYANNKEMFERYTQALIDNYKNGMDGRTE